MLTKPKKVSVDIAKKINKLTIKKAIVYLRNKSRILKKGIDTSTILT